MKKLLFIIVLGLFMTSCSTYMNAGGGGCGVWMPKKYSGAAKQPRNWSSYYRTGVH